MIVINVYQKRPGQYNVFSNIFFSQRFCTTLNLLLKESSFRQKCSHHIPFVIRKSFFLPKQSQKSRSILLDGSRSLGLVRKGKFCVIVKFQRTDLVICSYSRQGKTPSYS